ncbi:MAG TPA: trehalose-phosphatase [Candidatus Dormibacteraeota bacterium]|jgi:trehalose 6-phosphate phosphatase
MLYPLPPNADLRSTFEKFGDIKPHQLLLATDFDGTLAPIVPEPAAARALSLSLVTLDRLVDLGVKVAVISGRSQQDLRNLVPIAGVRLLGENGIGEPTRLEAQALKRFNSIAGRVVVRQPGVWLEVKPGSTSIHFRQAPDAGPRLRAALLPAADDQGLVAGLGRMVIEVRASRADKTRALSVLLNGLESKAVIYAGDDECDRGVFELLGRLALKHLSVGVCSREVPDDLMTRCDVGVKGPEAFALFLCGLLAWAIRHRGSDTS